MKKAKAYPKPARVYIPAKKLWTHQQKGFELLRGKKFFALLMAMRTGKTPLTLADFGQLELEGAAQDLFVSAPAGAYRTWETAMDEHLGADLAKRLLRFTWSAGMGVRAQRELDWFMSQTGRPRALLMNWEAFSNVKRARELAIAFLSQRKSVNVVDESTGIKSPNSERADFVVRDLAPVSDYRRILSGLPTPKSPLDAYMQFKFLDESVLGYKSFLGFKAAHSVSTRIPVGPPKRFPDGSIVMDDTGQPVRARTIEKVTGYVDIPEIREKIARHSYRVLLKDCYDLPPKMYSFREVEMTPEQKRIYEEVKLYATAELEAEKYVSVHMVVTKMLRLHQILCGHVRTEEGELYEIPENRTDSLLDLLEEYDGKAIVWCSYDADIRKVANAIAKRFAKNGRPAKVARFWGGNRATREAEEKMFKFDPECYYMVATAAAGGRGRTWVGADLVIYYSNTDDLEHREQSEERAQGFDKGRSVGYVDLVVRGTVDEKKIVTLRNKIDMAAAITGDNWREWLI